MKRPFVVVLASLLGFGSAGATDEAEIDHALQNLSRTLNAQLPSGNDEFMVISVAAGPGKRFTYFGVSSTPTELWNASMRSESFAVAVNTYCTVPGMAAFRDYGVSVAWNVSDKSGRHLYTNTVSRRTARDSSGRCFPREGRWHYGPTSPCASYQRGLMAWNQEWTKGVDPALALSGRSRDDFPQSQQSLKIEGC